MRIEDMDLDQLYELNAYICERIDHLLAKKDQGVLQQLHLGCEVSFETKSGRTLFGIVIKMNKKTVVVLVDGQHQYKLSPGLLKIVKDINQEGNVLDTTVSRSGK